MRKDAGARKLLTRIEPTSEAHHLAQTIDDFRLTVRQPGHNHMKTVRTEVYGRQDLGFFGLGSKQLQGSTSSAQQAPPYTAALGNATQDRETQLLFESFFRTVLDRLYAGNIHSFHGAPPDPAKQQQRGAEQPDRCRHRHGSETTVVRQLHIESAARYAGRLITGTSDAVILQQIGDTTIGGLHQSTAAITRRVLRVTRRLGWINVKK